MIRAWSVPEVRAAEQAAMSHLQDGELMQRAATGLAQVAATRLEQRGGTRVVALIGSGDNGGDALFALARLVEAGYAGAAVLVAPQVHEAGLQAVREAGADVVAAVPAAGIRPEESTGHPAESLGGSSGLARASELVAEADVLLDAVVGIGGQPALRAPVPALLDALPETAWVIAVDLPSGTDPSGEQASPEAVFADETVTFGCAKPVHLSPVGELATGLLTVIDIGVDLDSEATAPAGERLTPDDVALLWPVPGPSDQKYSRGVLGLVTGSTRYPGAGVLSTLGALGAGPGMVRQLGPEAVVALVHTFAPEVVAGPGRVQAYVVGSGLDLAEPAAGAGETAEARAERLALRRQVEQILAGDLPVVVDAGALELVNRRSAPTLLTPHAGELATLLTRLRGEQVDRSEVEAAPLPHAREAAERTGATVLLKGATTLVVPPPRADGSGATWRSQADAPAWLATAGAGDVLAGIAGTLLAAGLDPVDAGSMAALVHGFAAEASNPGGPVRALGVAQHVASTVARIITRRE